MAGKTLRTIQPAHKSDKVTVAQTEKAWRTVAHNTATGAASSTAHSVTRNSATGRFSSPAAGSPSGSGKKKPSRKARARTKR